MRNTILLVLLSITITVSSQVVKKEKIFPKSDTTKAEGNVYERGDVVVRQKSDISAAMLTMEGEVRNSYESFVHIDEVYMQITYNKTTQNAKGIYKTSEKHEKERLKDIVLKPQSSIFFKKTESMDKDALHGIVYLTGEIADDKFEVLKPSNLYKKKLNETATVCGGFYSIEFAIYIKKIKVESAYLNDGSPAMQFIPYLVLKNKAKRDVSFKGNLEVMFTYNGLQRNLKFDLPGMKAGEKKEREAKGAIPIVNYIPDVYFLQMMNTPEVNFKE